MKQCEAVIHVPFPIGEGNRRNADLIKEAEALGLLREERGETHAGT